MLLHSDDQLLCSCRYEGESLVKLIDWLRSGSLEREAPLLRVLESMPIPKKLTDGEACGTGATAGFSHLYPVVALLVTSTNGTVSHGTLWGLLVCSPHRPRD